MPSMSASASQGPPHSPRASSWFPSQSQSSSGMPYQHRCRTRQAHCRCNRSRHQEFQCIHNRRRLLDHCTPRMRRLLQCMDRRRRRCRRRPRPHHKCHRIRPMHRRIDKNHRRTWQSVKIARSGVSASACISIAYRSVQSSTVEGNVFWTSFPIPVTPSGNTCTLTVPDTSPVVVNCMMSTSLFASGSVLLAVFKLYQEPPVIVLISIQSIRCR